MPSYLLAYHGGGEMAQDEAERNKILAQWGKWFEDLGPALVDGGNPVMRARTISSKRERWRRPEPSQRVQPDQSAAVKLAQDCPVLVAGGTIEVAETFNAM